jgi:hypothetical protein
VYFVRLKEVVGDNVRFRARRFRQRADDAHINQLLDACHMGLQLSTARLWAKCRVFTLALGGANRPPVQR